MENFYPNLAHFAHGMSFMFFLFAAANLFKLKGKNRLLAFLFVQMVFWSFLQAKDFGFLFEGYRFDPLYINLSTSIDMWCIPLVLLYFFEIIFSGWVNKKKIILSTAPSLLFTLLYLWLRTDVIILIQIIYSNIVGICVTIIVFKASSKYDNYIRRNYSYREGISVSWVRIVIVLLLFNLCLWNVIVLYDGWLGDAVFYLTSILIWVYIYFYSIKHSIISIPGLRNPFIGTTTLSEEKTTDKEQNGSSQKYPFGEKLAKLMEGKQLYLNSKLTLSEVASQLGTNRTYLSEFLNDILNTTFYDYVNGYRVVEACRLLTENKDKPLSAIAEECGFNSLSTFRRSFTKETKLSPSEFRSKK